MEHGGGCSLITFRHSSWCHLGEPKEKWLPRVLFFPDTSVAGSRVWPHYGSICECHWSGLSYLRLFQVLPLGKKKGWGGRGRQTRTLLAGAVSQDRRPTGCTAPSTTMRPRNKRLSSQDVKTGPRQCEAALTSSETGAPCKINRGHYRRTLLSPPVRWKENTKKNTPSETLAEPLCVWKMNNELLLLEGREEGGGGRCDEKNEKVKRSLSRGGTPAAERIKGHAASWAARPKRFKKKRLFRENISACVKDTHGVRGGIKRQPHGELSGRVAPVPTVNLQRCRAGDPL